MAMQEISLFCETVQEFVDECYRNSAQKGFWSGPENDNVPTKIALLHSELSEMLEAYRKGNPPCDKDICIGVNNEGTPNRITSMEEEVADVFIRLGDLCGRLGIDLGRVTLAKMEYNSKREHMHGGKRV